MQKVNANKFTKGSPSLANNSYQAASHSAQIESETNLTQNSKPNTSGGNANSLEGQTMSSGYAVNSNAKPVSM